MSPDSSPRPFPDHPQTSADNYYLDNVDAPLKPVMATFPARLFLAAVAVGPFYVLGLMLLANKYLPPSDATNFKNFLLTCLTSLVVGSGGGAIVSSWVRTLGKVKNQLA